MADNEYLDVVGFIEEGRDKKRKPVTIGYAYKNNKGDLSIKLRSIPVGGSWDGSLVVQKRRERDAGQSNGQRPAGGGGEGHGGGEPDSDDIPF